SLLATPITELSCLPENTGVKSRLASRLKSAFKIADGALNPEFEVGEVNATFLPLRSAGVLIGLSAGTMSSISYAVFCLKKKKRTSDELVHRKTALGTSTIGSLIYIPPTL